MQQNRAMPNRVRIGVLLASLLVLGACAEPVTRHSHPRILTMGDSLLSWNRASGKSVSDLLEVFLAEPVVDRSVPGAKVIYGLPISGAMGMRISRQYRAGDWDWIVLNGGGNDLWLGCGCRRWEERMTRMISADGLEGSIPDEVRRLRGTGAKVIYVGYLRSPGAGSPIEHCRNEGDEFERRLSRLAATDPGITFLPIRDMVPHGDRSHHSFDMIHPSVKASTKIALRIARVIRGDGSLGG